MITLTCIVNTPRHTKVKTVYVEEDVVVNPLLQQQQIGLYYYFCANIAAALARIASHVDTHHLLRLGREAMLGRSAAAPLQNVVFGGVKADAYRLVSRFDGLDAGFEQ